MKLSRQQYTTIYLALFLGALILASLGIAGRQ
jgi:hypothetical protein